MVQVNQPKPFWVADPVTFLTSRVSRSKSTRDAACGTALSRCDAHRRPVHLNYAPSGNGYSIILFTVGGPVADVR
jgi:hypothetical protein